MFFEEYSVCSFKELLLIGGTGGASQLPVIYCLDACQNSKNARSDF